MLSVKYHLDVCPNTLRSFPSSHVTPLCCTLSLGADCDVYVSDPWCLAGKQTLASAPVLEQLHFFALGLLSTCIAHSWLRKGWATLSTLAHKPWSVLWQISHVGVSAIREVTVILVGWNFFIITTWKIAIWHVCTLVYISVICLLTYF